MAVDGNLKTRFETSALPLMRRVYAAALYLTEDRADADDLLQAIVAERAGSRRGEDHV